MDNNKWINLYNKMMIRILKNKINKSQIKLEGNILVIMYIIIGFYKDKNL